MEIIKNSLQSPGKEDDLAEDATGASTNDAVEEDGTPVLDEEDLEENDLDEEEAEQIIWEEPKEKQQ
jgi:hypothetical protein